MTVAKRLKAVRRYVALHTYEGRQGWRHFKEEATELWQYHCFRFEHWFSQIWPFRSLVWLLALSILVAFTAAVAAILFMK